MTNRNFQRTRHVEYARRQPPGSHRCHATGCEAKVPPAMFMCKDHWFMLPKPLRDAIWATYRRGQEQDKLPSVEYLKNARECIDYLAKKEGRSPPLGI